MPKTVRLSVRRDVRRFLVLNTSRSVTQADNIIYIIFHFILTGTAPRIKYEERLAYLACLFFMGTYRALSINIITIPNALQKNYQTEL